MGSAEEADEAIKHLHGIEIDGHYLTVSVSDRGRVARGLDKVIVDDAKKFASDSHDLFIRPIPEGLTSTDLRDLFSPYGFQSVVMKEGYAFVSLRSIDDCDRAILAMNGIMVS